MRTVRQGPSVGMLLLLACLALSSCGGESTGAAASDGTTPTSPAGSSATTAQSPSPSVTPSASSASPTATDTSAESVGEQLGAKIAYYAVAKAAGMDDSAKMDELASGICNRIESGTADTVGPWMKDTFQLEGDVAGKVAAIAIEFQCPEFKSKVGL